MTNKFDPVEYLKSCPTRLLMRYRKSLLAIHGRWLQSGTNEEECAYEITGDSNGSRWINMKQLKDELKTREHIPNKQEGKALRRAAAQGKTHITGKAV